MLAGYCIVNKKLGHQFTYEYASNMDKSRYYFLPRFCPDTFVPRHVCALTHLCPDTIMPRHDCA